VRTAITAETAAILVEPVQGEGGIRAADAEFLKGLRDVADEFGILLFFDEVQCGMGRTGKLFAYEWAGVAPDVMAIAKGIGGGFPIGACLATETVGSVMSAGTHGSTFGGNPLAMAIGNAVLDVMLADGFMPRVQKMGKALFGRLKRAVQAHPKILSGVRGTGLMLGLECAQPNTDVLARLRANGLLAVTAGENVVRILPPLIIDESHVEEAGAIVERACADIEG
jgi:acetylornithine/N-succinyldiaminopimelate aminotransferase